MPSMIAACHTRDHGIVNVEVSVDDLWKPPDFVPVRITVSDEYTRFDPRKNWDAWVRGVDGRHIEILCKHIAGMTYFQQDAPFMKRLEKYNNRLIHIVVGSGGHGGNSLVSGDGNGGSSAYFVVQSTYHEF